ncbi:MAG: ribonuclease Z [Nonlabens sp.]
MTSTEKENYILIEDDRNDIKGFAGFLESIFSQFNNKNVVIDLSKYKTVELFDLLEYLNLSNNHRGNKKSFVIINDALPAEDNPEELLIVPTLQEAEDIIQMEEIERDLGF